MVHSEEYNGIEITLCEERTAKLWVTVTAYIKDGKLTIEGQDLGDAPMTFFGTDEYGRTHRGGGRIGTRHGT